MIGTYYTPGLLAELAKKSNVRRLEIPVAPKGQRVSSYTKRYTDDWVCKTTIFDADGMRFGFALGCDVEKVSVSSRPGGLSVSFITSRWPEEGLDKRSVVLSAAASVEFKSEVGAVSMIEETHSGIDTIMSFFEDETSGEPWLVIIEPD